MARAEAADFGAFVPGPRCVRVPAGSGPLDGLTFAVKDVIDVAGAPTGAGNPDWLKAQRAQAASAPAVDALLAAGATLVGKTITDELAFSLEGANAHYGTPVNPKCPDRLPGGSSSGSAVAVAAGRADFALGADTGGSVRVPASFVGVFGFRPTHGAIPLTGVTPLAPSYDTVGWFARDGATLHAVGDMLAPSSASPRALNRLLLVRDAFALADPRVASSLRETCATLGIAGEMTLFADREDEWLECYRVLQGAEIWRQFGDWITSAQPKLSASIAARFADAASITPSDVARYQPVRRAFAARVRAAIDDGAALAMPTAPCVALPVNAAIAEISDFYRRALMLTSVAGHAGAPQLTIPAGRVDGCPVGLSIVGLPGRDHALLDFARRQPLPTDHEREHDGRRHGP